MTLNRKPTHPFQSPPTHSRSPTQSRHNQRTRNRPSSTTSALDSSSSRTCDPCFARAGQHPRVAARGRGVYDHYGRGPRPGAGCGALCRPAERLRHTIYCGSKTTVFKYIVFCVLCQVPFSPIESNLFVQFAQTKYLF